VNEVHPSPKVPTKDWVNLLKTDLKLRAADMVEAQLHSLTNMVMVKLKTEDLYTRVSQLLMEGVVWSQFGEKVYGWSVQEALTTIKIINLTCHINLDKVKAKMEEFGVIVSSKLGTVRELPGVLDGTLQLRMRLKEGAILPSFIEIGAMGESLQVFCDQQERVCFRCLQKGHIAPYCRRRAKALDHSRPLPKSWATIAGGFPALPVVQGGGQVDEAEDGAPLEAALAPPVLVTPPEARPLQDRGRIEAEPEKEDDQMNVEAAVEEWKQLKELSASSLKSTPVVPQPGDRGRSPWGNARGRQSVKGRSHSSSLSPTVNKKYKNVENSDTEC
jgi:hypothetical protein